MTPTLEQALAAARLDPLAYALLSDPNFQAPPHIQRLNDEARHIYDKPGLRISTSMPPQHGKTYYTAAFIAHYIGRNSKHRVIHVGYSQDRADDYGRMVRSRVQSEIHAAIFPEPEARVSTDTRAVDHFGTVAGGQYYAVGVGGALTGRGADVIIVDDSLKGPEEANSFLFRERLKAWFSSVLFTRLQPGGAMLLIGTRWHEDDLIGWLHKEQAGLWKIVNFAALAEENDPLGRPIGAALWPERYDVDYLEAIKGMFLRAEEVRGMEGITGQYAWQSLYQQNPLPASGNRVKKEWLRYYDPTKVNLADGQRCLSFDTAFKAKEINDPTGMVDLVKLEGKFYIVEGRGRRLEYPALKSWVVSKTKEVNPGSVLIEDKASGQVLLQDLKLNEPDIPVVAIKAEADKETRFSIVTDLFAAEQVYMPEGADWLPEFLRELLAFPLGKHDDCCDALSQGLRWLKYRDAGDGCAVV